MTFDPIRARRALGLPEQPQEPQGLPGTSPAFDPARARQRLSRSAQPVAERVYGSSPEKEARYRELADRFGLQIDTVRTRQQDVEIKELAEAIDRASPTVRSMLQDVDFARLAQDDIEALSGIEGFFQGATDLTIRAPGAGGASGVGMVMEGTGEFYNILSRMTERGLSLVLPDAAMEALYEKEIVPWWLDPAEILKRPGREIMEASGEFGVPEERQWWGTDITGGMGQMAAQIVMLMVTGGTGTAGTAILGAQGIGQQSMRQEQEGVLGESIGTDIALLTGGGITAISEKMGLDLILKRVPPAIRNGVMRKLADMGIAGGIEAAEEMIEGIMHNLTAYAYYDPDAEIFEGLSREAIAAGGAGALMRGIITAITPGRMGGIRGNNAQLLKDAEARVALSAVRERSPAAFKGMLDRVVPEDHRVEIPASEVNAFYQSEVSDETLEQMGVARVDFDAALLSNTDITIPMANYLTHFSDTEFAAAMDEHRRVNGEALSRAEMQVEESGYADDIVRSVQQSMQRVAEERQQEQSGLHGKIAALARRARPKNTAVQAEADATAFTAMVSAIGDMTNNTTDAMMERFGFEVRGMSDIPPGGATAAVTEEAPPAATPAPSPTADEVFEQPEVWHQEIEVEMDDGSTETMKAGEVKEALDQRRFEADALLRCLTSA